jgi:hypothetical protein
VIFVETALLCRCKMAYIQRDMEHIVLVIDIINFLRLNDLLQVPSLDSTIYHSHPSSKFLGYRKPSTNDA